MYVQARGHESVRVRVRACELALFVLINRQDVYRAPLWKLRPYAPELCKTDILARACAGLSVYRALSLSLPFLPPPSFINYVHIVLDLKQTLSITNISSLSKAVRFPQRTQGSSSVPMSYVGSLSSCINTEAVTFTISFEKNKSSLRIYLYFLFLSLTFTWIRSWFVSQYWIFIASHNLFSTLLTPSCWVIFLANWFKKLVSIMFIFIF